MIKRTLYFGNPAYLSLRDRQLEVHLRQASPSKGPSRTIPIEDVGVVLLDDPQRTITHGALNTCWSQSYASASLPSPLDPPKTRAKNDAQKGKASGHPLAFPFFAPFAKQLPQTLYRGRVGLLLRRYINGKPITTGEGIDILSCRLDCYCEGT